MLKSHQYFIKQLMQRPQENLEVTDLHWYLYISGLCIDTAETEVIHWTCPLTLSQTRPPFCQESLPFPGKVASFTVLTYLTAKLFLQYILLGNVSYLARF